MSDTTWAQMQESLASALNATDHGLTWEVSPTIDISLSSPVALQAIATNGQGQRLLFRFQGTTMGTDMTVVGDLIVTTNEQKQVVKSSLRSFFIRYKTAEEIAQTVAEIFLPPYLKEFTKELGATS